MGFHIFAKILLLILVLRAIKAKSLNATGPQSRIVGGLNAAEGQLPYQVSLLLDGSHHCGGSILAKDFVLTAAHCVISEENRRALPVGRLSIRAGSIWIDSEGQVVGVDSLKIHPGFLDYNNDVALVKLSSYLHFNSQVKPIALANVPPPAGSQVLTSGWGNLWHNGPSFPLLQYTTLTVLSISQCRQLLNNIPTSILCLSHTPNNGICNGDGGGPAVLADKLVGVTNYLVGDCESTSPDTYANVATHVSWILYNMK